MTASSASLLKWLEGPKWADDPRFATNTLRVANRSVLVPLLRQATVFKTTAEWVTQLEAVGVPCGPINDLAQVFADPQVQARGLAMQLPHALAGLVPQVASPIRLSETPVEYRNALLCWVSIPGRCWSRCWGCTRMRWRLCGSRVCCSYIEGASAPLYIAQ